MARGPAGFELRAKDLGPESPMAVCECCVGW